MITRAKEEKGRKGVNLALQCGFGGERKERQGGREGGIGGEI